MKLLHRVNALENVLVLLLGLFAGLFALEQVYNYDIWWHLKSGQWILSEGAIPYKDIYSFSTTGANWLNSSWLSGPVFLLLNQLGGIDLLILFKAVLIGLAFAGACIFLIKSGVNPYLAILLIGWAVIEARFRFLLRPQLFMFPAIVSLFWLLSRNATRNQWLAFLAVPLAVLWVNLHGTAFLAPVFGLFLVMEVISQKIITLDKVEKTETSLQFALLLFLSLLVSMMFTPYGIELIQYVIERSIVDDTITNSHLVEEHMPLKWGERTGYWALLIATALSFIPVYGRVRLFHLFTFLGTSVLSLTSVRYIGLAAIIQAMLLGLNIQKIIDQTIFKHLLTTKTFKTITPMLLIVTGVFAFESTFTANKVYKWGLGINESRFPVEEVEYLKQIQFKGNLYNAWEAGGYILWHLPEARIFIDGRVLPEQVKLKEMTDSMSLSDFSDYLSLNDVRAALLNKKDALNLRRFENLPQYQLSSFSEKHVVYLRNDISVPPGMRSVVKFKYVQPQSYDVSYLIPLALGPQSQEVEVELKQAISMSPNNFTLLYQYGVFLEASRRQDALETYVRAAEANPSLGFSHYKIGLKVAQLALKQKKWDQAIFILLKAIDSGNSSAEHYFLLGTAYYKKNDLLNAEEAYLNALNLNPEQVGTLQNIGFLMVDAKRFHEAQSYFEKATTLEPSLESAHYGLALALDGQMNPEAVIAWKTFLKNFPNSQWAQNAFMHLEKLEK